MHSWIGLSLFNRKPSFAIRRAALDKHSGIPLFVAVGTPFPYSGLRPLLFRDDRAPPYIQAAFED